MNYKKLDNIINSIYKNNLIENSYIKKIKFNIILKKKVYFFGIFINIVDNSELFKIFIHVLKNNINFKNIIFCFCNNNLDYDALNTLRKLDTSINYIYIKFYNKNKNTLLYYFGLEILTKYTGHLGILSSNSWINCEYFKNGKILINNYFNSFVSLYNDKSTNYEKFKYNNINLLLKHNFNDVSLFFKENNYNKIIKKLIMNDILNFNLIDYDLIVTDDSYIQNLDFLNIDKDDLELSIKDLLLKPKNYENLNITYTFKLGENNINKLFRQLKNEINFIYQEIEGGLGNQLFILFNLISLSKKYNLKISPFYEEKKYFKIERRARLQKNKNLLRKRCIDYEIFNNINFNNKINDNCKIYNEKKFTYKKINLEKNKNYFINGYFQSYKYFINYYNDIKNILNINYNTVNEIKKYYKNFKKKILGIHIRLGDYLKISDYYKVQIDYYKKALSYYNLEKYKIIIFSDDYDNCIEFIKPLELNYIDARIYSDIDEIQFYMLILCDIKICTNSTFSLMSCYMNEIYKFIENSEYLFPSKWFEINGPSYNIYDLIQKDNDKFKIINLE